MPLNYKYRLLPTAAQAHALNASMRLIRWGWNLAVRRERWARKLIPLGREADLHVFLAEQVLKKKLTGARAGKFHKLVAGGMAPEEALATLNAADIQRAWNRKRTGLSVEFAMAATNAAKQAMAEDRLGMAWAKLMTREGIFMKSWEACWKRIREAPRKNPDRHKGWINVQMQNRNPLLWAESNDRGENFVDLGIVMPSLSKAACKVRFLQHRAMPADAKIVEMKVIRQRTRYWLVLTLDNEVPKDFPATGRNCGIDPGQKTPCTLAGESMTPGVDGEEFAPGRPLTKALKKLRRLQRKLDRQRRANNPECFREDGTWIKGRRLSRISRGMRDTEDRIAAVHESCANIRKDYWNKASNQILETYDTVFLGDWKDGTPEQKGRSKKARKKKFAESGEKRGKGQAAQQRTRERVNRDNALGVFRQALEEKAKRSVNRKQVVMVQEGKHKTTKSCCNCGAQEGPTGVKGLAKRAWKCPACGYEQQRDRGAAWNILQAGLRQAGGQPVTEGRNPLVAGGIRAGDGSATGIERTSASGQVGAIPGEALASAEPIVRQGDRKIEGRDRAQHQRAGPQPLAEGTVSSSNNTT